MDLEWTWPSRPFWGSEWPIAWADLNSIHRRQTDWSVHADELAREERQPALALACLSKRMGFAVDSERCVRGMGLYQHFTTADDSVLRLGAQLRSSRAPRIQPSPKGARSDGPVCRHKLSRLQQS